MHAGTGDDTIISGLGGGSFHGAKGVDAFYVTSVGGLYDVNPAGLPGENSAVFWHLKRLPSWMAPH